MAKLTITFEYVIENNMDLDEVLHDINTMSDDEIRFKYGDVDFDIEENVRLEEDKYAGWLSCFLDTLQDQAKPKPIHEPKYDGNMHWWT